jgi:hypothetical protein
MNFLMIKDTDLIIKLIKLDGSIFRSQTTMSVRPLGDTYSKINIEISCDDFNSIKKLTYDLPEILYEKADIVVLKSDDGIVDGFYFYGARFSEISFNDDNVKLEIISDYHEYHKDVEEFKSIIVSLNRDFKLNELGI